MVEFNLLPDVKLEFIKARNLKRLVISVSTIVAAACLGIFILLLIYVYVIQRVRIHDLNSNINTSITKVNPNSNLNDILTVQNQLKSLPGIESQTPDPTKLFNYLSELTPVNATISTISLDFGTNSISIQGAADGLNTVNQFVDTLKFTTFNDNINSDGTSNSSNNVNAFSQVVLASFGYSNQSDGSSSATYTITFDFNPDIFSANLNSDLNIPTKNTTRSVLDTPTVLFKSNTVNGSN